MEVKEAAAVEAKAVEHPDADKATIRWLIGPESGAPTCYLRRFDLAGGGHTPRHSHAWEHEVYILAGQGKVFSGEDGERPVAPGDVIYVPPNEEHQFINDHQSDLAFLCIVPVAALQQAPSPNSCSQQS